MASKVPFEKFTVGQESWSFFTVKTEPFIGSTIADRECCVIVAAERRTFIEQAIQKALDDLSKPSEIGIADLLPRAAGEHS